MVLSGKWKVYLRMKLQEMCRDYVYIIMCMT